MVPTQVPRLRVGALLVMAVTFGCSDRNVTDGSPELQATVEPIYDENGQPQSSYYSANSQMTWTTDSSFEPVGASYTRNYFEEYSWLSPYHTWDNVNSYSSGDLPFGSSVPPEIDVGSARLALGAASAPEVRNRSGAIVQPESSRPSMASDTIPMAPITLPTGGPPGSPSASTSLVTAGISSRTGPARPSFDGPARRGAAVERLVATRQTSARVLARLRNDFDESPGRGGVFRFTKGVGTTVVTAVFNPGIGAITEMTTREGDRLLAQTTYRYKAAPKLGGFVLEEVVTQLFGPTGAKSRAFTQTYRDINVK